MTPKEKALELIHKYDLMQTYIEGFSYDDAKQCALIAVNEILNNDGFSSSLREWNIFKKYWEKVKQEIEKL